MSNTVSNLISSLAFLLSAYSLWRQKQSEKINKQSANVSANFIKIWNRKVRFKIYNTGKALARNVNIQFLEENQIIAEIDKKLPINLHEHQTVEFPVVQSMESPNKIKFILIWDDDRMLQNKKEMELSL